MSLPRFVLPWTGTPGENVLVALEVEQARHLQVLRIRPGDALELLLPGGVWRAELAEADKRGARVRLVAPLSEDREPPLALRACLPLTAQLSLWDDMLPACVELGATRITPVVYGRSEYEARRTEARRERWLRIVQGAAEQSHRSRIPILDPPQPFQTLLEAPEPQRWVAYELPTGAQNPLLGPGDLAFTHGPEGGITDGEFQALAEAGWQPLTLGRSILRAVTCPAAILGAVQAQLGGSPLPQPPNLAL